MKYFYHFCAIKQLAPGAVNYISGTIAATYSVSSEELYAGLVKQIAEVNKWDEREMVILSLSLLYQGEG